MNQVIHVNRERIKRRITELSKVGRTPEGGVTRKALTQEEWEAQELVAKWMEEAGLVVRRDSFGNLIGRKEGTNLAAPTVMIGSHVDTVPNGGDFDGTIGVIAGIEVAQIIENEQIPIEHSLEIVAFSDEEGTRFQGGLFGSRAMVGKINDNELSRKDEKGVSRFEALQAFRLSSLSVDDIKQEGDVKVYLEMHIEQGPYLEKVEEPVGIVTGIAGPAWLEVKLIGESGHAGTVPMSLRRDPLAGAAEIIWNIEQICSKDLMAPTVGTIGKMTVKPGGANVIPEMVEFTLDLRDVELARRDERLFEVKEKIEQICHQRGLSFEMTKLLLQKPVSCADHITLTMEQKAQALGLNPVKLISGAGHDAMSLNEMTDVGMIFVRSRGGISHNPREWSDWEDISLGTALLAETALNI